MRIVYEYSSVHKKIATPHFAPSGRRRFSSTAQRGKSTVRRFSSTAQRGKSTVPFVYSLDVTFSFFEYYIARKVLILQARYDERR